MYHLYILLCADNSLYTGITTDINKRMAAHRAGTGSKYVRSRLPFELVYKAQFKNRSVASKRESEIKSWPRAKKIEELKLVI